MAVWKVKSQTGVPVELLRRRPQSDCDRIAEDLQADPPAKTIRTFRVKGRLSQPITGQYPGTLREHPAPFQVRPFLAPISLASLLESLAQAPSEASRKVVTI